MNSFWGEQKLLQYPHFLKKCLSFGVLNSNDLQEYNINSIFYFLTKTNFGFYHIEQNDLLYFMSLNLKHIYIVLWK